MKKHILIIIAALVLVTFNTHAQTDPQHTEDEKAIRQVLENITAAWAEGDGKKFADNFTDDVDYTIWNGMYSSGREANEKGHQRIFDTFFKGTTLEINVRKIRFLSESIAAAHLQGGIYKDGREVEIAPNTVPLMIFQKTEGTWKVVVFQNTPIIKRGEWVSGRKTDK